MLQRIATVKIPRAMPPRSSLIRPILLVVAALSCIAVRSATPEDGFITENNVAMEKMMAGMEVKPTGDVDRDFTSMMIPHHQGAIDMAVAELRYGHNEQLRRIAQEIIIEQQQEIAAMHLALGEKLPPSVTAPTQITRAGH